MHALLAPNAVFTFVWLSPLNHVCKQHQFIALWMSLPECDNFSPKQSKQNPNTEEGQPPPSHCSLLCLLPQKCALVGSGVSGSVGGAGICSGRENWQSVPNSTLLHLQKCYTANRLAFHWCICGRISQAAMLDERKWEKEKGGTSAILICISHIIVFQAVTE